ncbi:hypothetical protein GCM10009431_09150 [Gaetbulibacter jejuensis]|uniref:Uncharacterized protein n=2 Tax=Flavobacteriaceae TaxID=49546 RepID=A0ABP3UTD7_9FLAO
MCNQLNQKIMELVLSLQDLEPHPKQGFEKQEGLLNSNYKQIVKRNLKALNSNTIFGNKHRIKTRQFVKTSSVATLLKLSVFVVLLTAIL